MSAPLAFSDGGSSHAAVKKDRGNSTHQQQEEEDQRYLSQPQWSLQEQIINITRQDQGEEMVGNASSSSNSSSALPQDIPLSASFSPHGFNTTRPGSNIIYEVTAATASESPQIIRKGHLLGLQGISSAIVDSTTGATISRPVDTLFLYNSIAAFLAVREFNDRSNRILPHLPELLGTCDFYWTYEFRDTQWSGLEAARQLAEATGALSIQGRDHQSLDGKRQNRKRQRQRDMQQQQQEEGLSSFSIGDFGLVDNSAEEQNPLLESQGEQSSTPGLSAMEQSEQRQPFALYGAHWSSVSYPLSLLSGSMALPQISGSSTSASLDYSSPFFMRTVASNDGDARAAMLYYHTIGVTHVATLYINDSWGFNYHASLQKYADYYDISFSSFPYDKCCVEQAIAALHDSQLKHIFAIMHNWKEVLNLASQYDIIGRPDYSWIGAEEKKWTGKEFAVDKQTEGHLAQALHGIGTLNIFFEPVPTFNAALQAFADDPKLQKAYVDSLAYPEILLDNPDFNVSQWPRYVPQGFAEPIFDAILALGVTACNSTASGLPELFTGPELFEAFATTTRFQGVSGDIYFDPLTGTREASGMRYSIENVLLSEERSTHNKHKFASELNIVIRGDNIETYAPFIYHDNTTQVPPSLPPISNMEYNLISQEAQIIGYVMACIVLAASLFFLQWVARKRNIFVVRASQPVFLGQLAIGTVVAALSVFPGSLPGASTAPSLDPAMNQACLSQMWLATLGFVIAFSAVFSKTYRVNQLLNSGRGMRRIQVDAKDVMWPFIILMLINVAMLLCNTFVSPYQYERVEMDSYDRFGRSTETYGGCRPRDSTFYVFFTITGVFNGVGIIVAFYQSWKARNLPTEFSESGYLAVAMASLTETLFLGGPILLVVHNDPTAWYLVSTAVLCIGSMTILIPLMLPKYMARHQKMRGNSNMQTMGQSSRNGQSSRVSMISQGIHVSGLDLGQSDVLEPFEPKRGKMKIRRNSSVGAPHRASLFATAGNRSKQGSGMFSIGELSGATPVPFESTKDDINCKTNFRDECASSGQIHFDPINEAIRKLQAMGDSGFDMSDSDEEGGESEEVGKVQDIIPEPSAS